MQNLIDQGLKFKVILADPAWQFVTRSAKGKGKSPEKHYSTMTLDDICALPIAQLAAPDAALFLWGIWPRIFDCQRVIEAWGFKYSGLAWEWLKFNPKTGKYAFGCGYGTRKNLEPCLLARKGSPELLNRSVRDHMHAPRREHSRKPDETHQRIETMFAGPYLELFARQPRKGWTVWGNETTKFQEAACPC
ncbi:MAG: DNA methyltransferase [Rhizobiaceae bacterium]|nr:DNA methyltransferase [Rhizobiaceae bacterium]MCC0000941.1 DNA methyltransferase [Methylobacteriaceae bacterium]